AAAELRQGNLPCRARTAAKSSLVRFLTACASCTRQSHGPHPRIRSPSLPRGWRYDKWIPSLTKINMAQPPTSLWRHSTPQSLCESQRRSESALKPPLSNCWNEYVRQGGTVLTMAGQLPATTERRRSPLTPFCANE